MNTNKIAEEGYKKFSKAEGSDFIAGEFALKTILHLVDTFNVKQILELGLGIGSISDTVLNYAKKNNKEIHYTGTEANEFCLGQLPLNLETNYQNLNLLKEASELEVESKYDLIIVDGSDDSLESIKDHVKQNSILYIEGYRIKQVNALRSLFPKSKYVEIISSYKPPEYGVEPSDKWSGGGQLIFINPNTKQNIFWLKNKIRTSFVYKVVRKFKK